MQFLIADTFTDSLTRLSADEQKSVKTTAFDLQTNPAHPSLKFHRLDRAKDPNFWSVRAGRDIRLIVHKSSSSLVLCYVDHHDRAYAWAERRKLTAHPTTGAAQLVEVRETVQEVVVPVYVEAPAPPPTAALSASVTDDDLLAYGVPPEWLDDVRAATEDSLLELVDHLPGEAAEALLELATGSRPPLPAQLLAGDPFEHPDALRRFRVMEDVDELERALEYPWEKWTIFLHPSQRDWVERDFAGPARVAGSAGTGKTIVALHRAVSLARTHQHARVLLTTFSEPLADALRHRLALLVAGQPRFAERIEVHAVDALAVRLYSVEMGPVAVASTDVIRTYLREASEQAPAHRFTETFLQSEWEHVVDAWQLATWDDYRAVRRLGRKTGLPEQQRAILWEIFSAVRARLEENGLVTRPSLFAALASRFAEDRPSPYEFVVVDEAQDMGVPQLRLFAALVGDTPNGLFFAGDVGQRIFQQPFSWRSLGVDVRGRAKILKVNYRTSHQIREQADRLLDPVQADADGIQESRVGTVSVFNGPAPVVRIFEDEQEEIAAVAEWIVACQDEGVASEELAVFVRSSDEVERAVQAVELAGLTTTVLGSSTPRIKGSIAVATMHLAKGLEFRAVAVMACDDEVIPSQARIESIADSADLEDVYATERHLLYVACTRARDFLHVSGVEPASEFLEDVIA